MGVRVPGERAPVGHIGGVLGRSQGLLSLHQEADAILDPSRPLTSEGDTTHGPGEMTQQPANRPGHAGGRDQQGA